MSHSHRGTLIGFHGLELALYVARFLRFLVCLKVYWYCMHKYEEYRLLLMCILSSFVVLWEMTYCNSPSYRKYRYRGSIGHGSRPFQANQPKSGVCRDRCGIIKGVLLAACPCQHVAMPSKKDDRIYICFVRLSTTIWVESNDNYDHLLLAFCVIAWLFVPHTR